MSRRHETVRERVAELPDGVQDCEGCGGEETMQIRRSSLRPEPCADDVSLKCSECRHVRTHGIPVTRETYEREMGLRNGSRTLDFVDDGPYGPDVETNLKALGYVEY